MLPDDLNEWKKSDFEFVSNRMNKEKDSFYLLNEELKNVVFVDDFIKNFFD